MASKAYYAWLDDGAPWTNATPVKDYVSQLGRMGWDLKHVGTIGDEAHLTANRPEDHTPFSATGWPNATPYGIVTALDLSGSHSNGIGWQDVAWWWLREARARRTPWVKYLTFQGKRYDVRHDWNAVDATGHDEHVHVSFRTDWINRSIEPWKVLGDMTSDDIWPAILGDVPEESLATGEVIPSENRPANAALAWALRHSYAARQYGAATYQLAKSLNDRPPATVDPLALAEALASRPAFVDALATAVAAKLGLVPTAREIAKAVGELVWHGKAE